MIFSMWFQSMNALPIWVITNWGGANNSSFLADLLQTKNMPKPQFARWTQNQSIILFAKGATPPVLVCVCLTFVENFHMVRKFFWRRRKLEGIWKCVFVIPSPAPALVRVVSPFVRWNVMWVLLVTVEPTFSSGVI